MIPESVQGILIGVAIIGSYLLFLKWWRRTRKGQEGEGKGIFGWPRKGKPKDKKK